MNRSKKAETPVPSVFQGILAGLFWVVLVSVFWFLDLVFSGGFFGSFWASFSVVGVGGRLGAVLLFYRLLFGFPIGSGQAVLVGRFGSLFFGSLFFGF